MTFDSPKSASSRSESSSLDRYSRFSGLMSVRREEARVVRKNSQLLPHDQPSSQRSRRIRERLTAVNDSVRMQVLDGAHDGPDELCRVLLEEVRLGADPIKQLAALAQVRHEVHCSGAAWGQFCVEQCRMERRCRTVVLSLQAPRSRIRRVSLRRFGTFPRISSRTSSPRSNLRRPPVEEEEISTTRTTDSTTERGALGSPNVPREDPAYPKA